MNEDIAIKCLAKIEMLSRSAKTMRSIFDLIAENGDAVAFEYFIKNHIRRLKYKDFSSCVYNAAAFLRTRTNPNIRYAFIKGRNSLSWYVAFWASLAAGLTPVLLGAERKSEEDVSSIERIGRNGIIISDSESHIREMPFISFDEIIASPQTNRCDCFWANEYILFSSGSSGEPTAIVFNGENATHQIEAAVDLIKNSDGIMFDDKYGKIKILSVLPLHHIFGFVAQTLWFMFIGKTTVIPDNRSLESLFLASQKASVTHVFGVPLIFDRVAEIIKHKLDSFPDKQRTFLYSNYNYNVSDVSNVPIKKRAFEKIKKTLFGCSVKYLISGGGELNERTLSLLNGIGYPLRNGYGMTELGILSVESSNFCADRIKGSVGVPLYGVQFRICEGELEVQTKTAGVRFDGKNEFTEDGYFKTGDLVTVDETGRYYVIGRKKRIIIKSDGENISPEHIEIKFREKLKSAVAVFGAEKNGRTAISLVAEKDANSDETIRKVKETNALFAANAKVELLFLVDSLPRIENGKINFSDLKEATDSVTPIELYRSEENDETEDEIEIKVRKCFAALTYRKCEEIYGDSHFFYDLNGNSLVYFELMLRLENEFNIKFSPNVYYTCFTVNDFAKAIREIKCSI